MGTVTLLLGIHNHQPQGNFDHVFAQGYEDCYRRLLDAIARHEGIRITLHHSGPLIEWIEANHPQYLEQLGELARSGRVELMGGGFYEPMLSVLPEQDARGQLELLADYWEAHAGIRPRGMWLAERVWEPDLARVIAEAGYRYTVVDDGHFLAAGMKRPMRGYYVTDKAGRPLCLFPISMELRYTIPFKPASETIDHLLAVADAAEDGDCVVTYGDDGEKFGMWPGTKQWVWDEGWLDQFFEQLERNSDRILTSTFSEVLKRHTPSGRVYLPTASYDEMGEWALPAEAQPRFHALVHEVEEQGHKEDWGPFVRGGIWQGFLAKYPESNLMHKRMCYVSSRVASAAEVAAQRDDPQLQDRVEQATRELYRGQCNCAYWHGLFGGLYLAKLRSAVHSHLIRADVAATEVLGGQQPVELERLDLDGDLSDEVILTGPKLGVTVNPGRGGTLMAIDDRVGAFCVSDVLTRRPEAYHAKVIELSQKSGDDDEQRASPKSIHEITTLKEEGLAEMLVYDPHQRLGLVDQFLAADPQLDPLRLGQAVELGDFKETPYEVLQASGGLGSVTLCRTGRVRQGEDLVEVALQKAIRLDAGTLTADYEITTHAPLGPLSFATELSLTLPSGPHPDGSYTTITTDGTREDPVTVTDLAGGVCRIELSDPLNALRLVMVPAPAATICRFPLETVSQSESGIERTYQGSTIIFIWPLELQAAESFKPRLTLKVQR
jgi:alpha-amylase